MGKLFIDIEKPFTESTIINKTFLGEISKITD